MRRTLSKSSPGTYSTVFYNKYTGCRCQVWVKGHSPGLLIRDIHVRSDLNIVLRVNLLNLFVKDLNSFLGTDVEAHHDIEHHFLRFCIHVEAMELDTIPITALKAASNTFARIPMILVRMIT